MKEASDALLSIGRFSEMTRLSIKALRLYDESGLLEPAYVDAQTGYRYYRPDQAVRAQAIRVLRSVDMPLSEITDALDGGLDTWGRVMREHRDRLDLRVSEQRQMLDSFTDILEGRRQLMPYDVSEKSINDQHVASFVAETDLASVKSAIESGFGTIVATLQEKRETPAGPPFLVMQDVIDEETSGRIEICVPVSPSFMGSETVESKTMTGGRMASTVHKGAYEEVVHAYQALSSWMTANACEPSGAPREIYLNDPTVVSVGEQLTEVAWPIQGGRS